jgi:hypothetical protein
VQNVHVGAKSRNPRFGCPRIARIISHTFGVGIDEHVVYRVLSKHYRPAPGGTGPSWLSFIGHMYPCHTHSWSGCSARCGENSSTMCCSRIRIQICYSAARGFVPQRFNSIAVVGAGAVGSFYGAMLARAGHRVTLIGRAAHVHAIEQDGLRLDMAGRVDVVHAGASVSLASVSGAHLLAVLRCRRSFVQALRELGLATSGSLTGAPLTGGVSVSNSLSRRSTMSCRLSKRFSAMTDRTPPGPRLRGLDCEVEQVSRVSRRSFMRESA